MSDVCLVRSKFKDWFNYIHFIYPVDYVTHQVEPQDLADGVLKGFRAGVELTANDCFELGRQNYNNGEWMCGGGGG